MISLTKNELLQGILTTIFLTATSTEFPNASACASFGVDCTCEQRPSDCPDRIPCCRYRADDQDITYCLKDSSICPSFFDHCESDADITCFNDGICCQHSQDKFCVCPIGYSPPDCLLYYDSDYYGDYGHQYDTLSKSPCNSTKQQSNSSDYTTPLALALAEATIKDGMSAPTESKAQPPAMSIGLTTFVVVIAVSVLLCIASVFIARLIFKRKDRSVETGIKSGNTDAEKTFQNLKTTQLNGNGEMVDHYDTLEHYDKGYETIDEYSLDDPNYSAIEDNEHLDVIAEADDENIEEADDNDNATTEAHQSEQTAVNNGCQTLLVQETPSIQ